MARPQFQSPWPQLRRAEIPPAGPQLRATCHPSGPAPSSEPCATYPARRPPAPSRAHPARRDPFFLSRREPKPYCLVKTSTRDSENHQTLPHIITPQLLRVRSPKRSHERTKVSTAVEVCLWIARHERSEPRACGFGRLLFEASEIFEATSASDHANCSSCRIPTWRKARGSARSHALRFKPGHSKLRKKPLKGRSRESLCCFRARTRLAAQLPQKRRSLQQIHKSAIGTNLRQESRR